MDIFGIVYEMRKERVWMVQTEQQYICIHQASHLNCCKNNANFTPIHSVFWRSWRARNTMSDTLTKCMTMKHLRTMRELRSLECKPDDLCTIVPTDVEKWQSKEIPKDCNLDSAPKYGKTEFEKLKTEKPKPTNAQLWSYE